MNNTSQAVIEKVRQKTQIANGCHLWTGALNPHGYGVIRFENRRQLLHRAVFKITKGEIPEGMVVMHQCDQRTCVNPAHLSLGTPNDNTQDMLSKGRGPSRKGENNGNSKLTQEQVAEIRTRFTRYSKANGARALAAEFGVSDAAIHAAAKQMSWA